MSDLLKTILRTMNDKTATEQDYEEAILASDWLKVHDAEVAAAAWDEGYTRGFYDREVMHGEVRDASEGPSENPYRAGATR